MLELVRTSVLEPVFCVGRVSSPETEIFHRQQFFGRTSGGNEAFIENCWSHLSEQQRVVDADHIWWLAPSTSLEMCIA